jgi:hypothetical protein
VTVPSPLPALALPILALSALSLRWQTVRGLAKCSLGPRQGRSAAASPKGPPLLSYSEREQQEVCRKQVGPSPPITCHQLNQEECESVWQRGTQWQ